MSLRLIGGRIKEGVKKRMREYGVEHEKLVSMYSRLWKEISD